MDFIWSWIIGYFFWFPWQVVQIVANTSLRSNVFNGEWNAFFEVSVNYRIPLCWVVLLVLASCSTKAVHICEINDNQHIGPCAQIANEAYIYALLSVNSYEMAENTPFILPENIREVRHADSKVSSPDPRYVDNQVYSNGSFQAKVFEIRSDIPEDGAATLSEIVIAFRGTEKFPYMCLIRHIKLPSGKNTKDYPAAGRWSASKKEVMPSWDPLDLFGPSLKGCVYIDSIMSNPLLLAIIHATIWHSDYWRNQKKMGSRRQS